jgi:HTH-type transcriptional regulator, transcriptional repressor of NAD biosynthesis genes
MTSLGIIIGKFMPPHRGHEYLIRFASTFVDELWIFTCTLPTEPIPGELRAQWMRELFPKARHVHIAEANPNAGRDKQGAQDIWAETVLSHLPHKPDYVFASEDYGWNFADSLGAQFIPVDPSRDQFPISGTELRSHPYRYWHFIPAPVRPYFVREIMIENPSLNGDKNEKTGLELLKTTAMLLNTLYVPPYQHFFSSFSKPGNRTLSDENIGRAQAALIRSLKLQARCFLFRCSAELDAGLPLVGRPDLWIRLRSGGPESENAVPAKAGPAEMNNIPIVEIDCDTGSVVHKIRDVVVERYKESL